MKLTKNFSLHEFDCNCGCEMPDDVKKNVKELAENLQNLRDKINKPVKITNSYRCVSHNKKVGGAKKSQHLKGKAADIQVVKISPDDIADIVIDMMDEGIFSIGGVGRYNTFTHVDIRGAEARWNFKK